MAQVRRRATYLQNNATAGGTTILNLAIKDTQEAIDDLTTPALNSSATADALVALKTVKLTLQNSAPYADNMPPAPMSQVNTWLTIAKNDLLTSNPNNDSDRQLPGGSPGIHARFVHRAMASPAAGDYGRSA